MSAQVLRGTQLWPSRWMASDHLQSMETKKAIFSVLLAQVSTSHTRSRASLAYGRGTVWLSLKDLGLESAPGTTLSIPASLERILHYQPLSQVRPGTFGLIR